MSSRFAIINLFGIWLFFGPEAAGLLAVLAFGLWFMLWPTVRFKKAGRERLASAFRLMPLLFLVGLFVSYKLYFDKILISGAEQEDHAGSLGFIYGLLRIISFSYVFLRAVDLIRSVAWGTERLINPIALTGYLGPFHMLIAGPISPYFEHVMIDNTPRPEPTFSQLLNCVNTITTGLFLKVVLAQMMKIFLFGVEGEFVVESWFDTAYLMVFLFFDFAGYSLIALGIGRLLHVPTPQNFDRPYLATSITDFWLRWHMSLGTFVRNNLYTPMQLFIARRIRIRRGAAIGALLPLAISFVLVGMWHRITERFLIWGIAMAILLVVEKLVRDRCLAAEWSRRPQVKFAVRLLGPIYTMVVITTSIYYVASEIFVG